MVDSTGWASIAQQALDMVKSGVPSISDAMSQIAPAAWEVLLKQVYLDAIANVCTAVMVLFICIGAALIINKYWKAVNSDSYESKEEIKMVVMVILYISQVASFITSVVLAIGLIKVINNPAYYAFQKLMVLGGLN